MTDPKPVEAAEQNAVEMTFDIKNMEVEMLRAGLEAAQVERDGYKANSEHHKTLYVGAQERVRVLEEALELAHGFWNQAIQDIEDDTGLMEWGNVTAIDCDDELARITAALQQGAGTRQGEEGGQEER